MDRKKQLDDFIEGKLSHEEAKDFLNWLISEEGEEEFSALIDEEWFSGTKEKEYAEFDMEKLLGRTKRAKGGGALYLSGKDSVSNRIPKRNGQRSAWLKVAASLVIIFSLSFLLIKWTEEPVSKQVESSLELVTRKNPSGIKTRIHLPDGSIVYLNAESTVSYPKSFVNNRTIHLTGEAFFEVKKDSLHPFSVVSDRLTTVALGTSFNIRAFEGDNSVEVTLATGKVKVSDARTNQTLTLLPGEAASLKAGGEVLEKYSADVSMSTQWVRGVLVFKNTSLKKIIKRLERWYGVEIHFKGKVADEKCSGEFMEGESLANVLRVLSYSVEFEYEIKGNQVIITQN
ncbi:FecR family protein [Echinicola shivajiensis]|uniref:FecR family protein n=1 Tax=Echinicola shivajiensis TaxID=1035916 RepID=UPI001BFC994F|nr:FecR family protein [Echinicola shivajiensis]